MKENHNLLQYDRKITVYENTTIDYQSLLTLICESLGLDKRRREAKMVASTIAMLVSHDTTTKGGGLP